MNKKMNGNVVIGLDGSSADAVKKLFGGKHGGNSQKSLFCTLAINPTEEEFQKEFQRKIGLRIRLRVLGVVQDDKMSIIQVRFKPGTIACDDRIPHIVVSHVDDISVAEHSQMLMNEEIQPAYYELYIMGTIKFIKF